METLNNCLIPATVLTIILYGTFKHTDVFSEFLTGAKSGFKTVLDIAPSLIGLLLAVNMLQSSGALDILRIAFSPLGKLIGIPEEVIPLALISPVSGSGSVGMFENILKEFGADSFVGRCASVMMGSTETTFYAVTLYYGSVNIKNTRHTLPSALCADFTSFILSPRFVNCFLNRERVIQQTQIALLINRT